jgi:hypothetical protein
LTRFSRNRAEKGFKPFSARIVQILSGFIMSGLVLSCTGVTSDPGLTSKLQIDGAQFRPGEFPSDDGGPAALTASTRHSMIVVDRFNEPVRGILGPTARAAAIGIDGSDDSWIVVASPPDVDSAGAPVAKGVMGLAADFPAGPFTLKIAAADEDGRFGAPATTTIVALDEEAPMGMLVVGLAWEGRADLDLHVVDALGGEAWSDDPNTWVMPPPGTPIDPNEFMKYGILDHDGNKDCVREARPKEHVIWQMPPPAGKYIVRVDTRAMCGDQVASWYAFASLNGTVVAQARGYTTPDDVLVPIDPMGRAGAGVLAFEFDVP